MILSRLRRGIVKPIRESFKVATITTVSLRELLLFYSNSKNYVKYPNLKDCSIVEFKAKGGNFREIRSDLNKDYGIKYYSGSDTRITIDYKQKRKPSGAIKNPLKTKEVKEIITYLDEYLEPHSVKIKGKKINKIIPSDIPIENITFEITSDFIQEITDSESNIFDVVFISEMGESSDFKEFIEKTMADQLRLGFKKTTLNLKQVIDTIYRSEGLKKNELKSKSVFFWEGYSEQDIFPKFNDDIVGHIYSFYLPMNFRREKQFYIWDKTRIELDGF